MSLRGRGRSGGHASARKSPKSVPLPQLEGGPSRALPYVLDVLSYVLDVLTYVLQNIGEPIWAPIRAADVPGPRKTSPPRRRGLRMSPGPVGTSSGLALVKSLKNTKRAGNRAFLGEVYIDIAIIIFSRDIFPRDF